MIMTIYKIMKSQRTFLFVILLIFLGSASIANVPQKEDLSKESSIIISKKELADKIKGGWAGQTIGVTYGGQAEFQYRGTFIKDYTPLRWDEDLPKWSFDNNPGLYDDIYMDLTFVEVFERLGLNAPVDSFAMAFATADYPLWHANQAARYNILNGIMPPESGHWKNNIHADCIDFQIEADFAGLMSPGMVNTSTEICDKIGHIMNYGDGWYAGVYVAAMYSMAFVSDDIDFIVNEALKTIPQEAKYYKCMKQVVNWYKQYPDDWKKTWFEVERSEWAQDLHCPEGVFRGFNIDATVNSAYCLIGLLYGHKDFGKTIDIATRCGQDADCNPATVGGILGVIIGYDNIPDYWMKPLKVVEDIDFKYTTTSLNNAYKLSLKHALELIIKNGGKVDDKKVTIKYQLPQTTQLEEAFPNIYPTQRIKFSNEFNRHEEALLNDLQPIKFNGTGIVVNGEIDCEDETYVAEVQVSLDGKIVKVIILSDSEWEVFMDLELPKGDHTVTLKWLNPNPKVEAVIYSAIQYSDKLVFHNK